MIFVDYILCYSSNFNNNPTQATLDGLATLFPPTGACQNLTLVKFSFCPNLVMKKHLTALEAAAEIIPNGRLHANRKKIEELPNRVSLQLQAEYEALVIREQASAVIIQVRGGLVGVVVVDCKKKSCSKVLFNWRLCAHEFGL